MAFVILLAVGETTGDRGLGLRERTSSRSVHREGNGGKVAARRLAVSGTNPYCLPPTHG